MDIKSTEIDGLKLIYQNIFIDNRGKFLKTFNNNIFLENSLNLHFQESFFSI